MPHVRPDLVRSVTAKVWRARDTWVSFVITKVGHSCNRRDGFVGVRRFTRAFRVAILEKLGPGLEVSRFASSRDVMRQGPVQQFRRARGLDVWHISYGRETPHIRSNIARPHRDLAVSVLPGRPRPCMVEYGATLSIAAAAAASPTPGLGVSVGVRLRTLCASCASTRDRTQAPTASTSRPLFGRDVSRAPSVARHLQSRNRHLWASALVASIGRGGSCIRRCAALSTPNGDSTDANRRKGWYDDRVS